MCARACACRCVQYIGNNHTRYEHAQHTKEHSTYMLSSDGWLPSEVPGSYSPNLSGTKANWRMSHNRHKNCMVHYSTQENSLNLEKSSSHKVCVCVRARARESLMMVRVMLHHLLSCFLAWFWFFFKCRGSRLAHDLFIPIGSYSHKDALHGRRCSVSGEKGTCFDWWHRKFVVY